MFILKRELWSLGLSTLWFAIVVLAVRSPLVRIIRFSLFHLRKPLPPALLRVDSLLQIIQIFQLVINWFSWKSSCKIFPALVFFFFSFLWQWNLFDRLLVRRMHQNQICPSTKKKVREKERKRRMAAKALDETPLTEEAKGHIQKRAKKLLLFLGTASSWQFIFDHFELCQRRLIYFVRLRTESGQPLIPPTDVSVLLYSYLIRPRLSKGDFFVFGGREPQGWQWDCPGSHHSPESVQQSQQAWRLDSSPDYELTEESIKKHQPPGGPPSFTGRLTIEHLREDKSWVEDLREQFPVAFSDPDCFLSASLMSDYLRWLHLLHTDRRPSDPSKLEPGPPIHIDLLWHTHLLSPDDYLRSTASRYGATVWHHPIDRKSVV